MSHDIHEGPDGAVIYDGCEECDERAKNPLESLCRLDGDNYAALRMRMLCTEFGRTGPPGYLTDNEAKLGGAMYLIAILEERHGRLLR